MRPPPSSHVLPRTLRCIGLVLSLALTTSVGVGAETASANGDDGETNDSHKAFFSGLKVRSIGPALMSGRIGDLAVDPERPHRYFVAVASGGVWKTLNNGITWAPVFDAQGSYSIGCLALDPNNPNVLWVGTGENNSQRSVGFGDGVYRTRDGGRNWEHLGLKESEHIGRIAIHPTDSDIVYVAAQGPLWRSGGDRGLYRTTDGGTTWERVLHVSDDTGINEVHLDPRNPDVLYASAYQRRRRVWTLINGGPESAIYKSTDGGGEWRPLTNGIPAVDKGRIGLALSPVNPDVIYAIVEAAEDQGGFFRSVDRGETWEKRSDYVANGPQYYNEIVCDPVKLDRVYSMDTFLRVTEDGGKTFQRVPGEDRHVDDHALWINPANTEHLRVGCDGGVYETYDRGQNWQFKENLPVTQFYRVSADHDRPFYSVYGGTQDNNTQGGPSRTTDRAGITSADWFITVGGDGYETVVDPTDPNVVYSQWQYGGLVRYDRRSGELTNIKPQPGPDDPPLKWNWDTPLILSPHDPHRLYFAANRLFRSDDRGNSWRAISGDLTRGLDRNTLPVMGRIQPVGAVAKHTSTSMYGNAVALAESPLVEDLLYVGTDDGLIHVTTDGGESWRKIEFFPGVPDLTYVSCLTASEHEPDTVFAAFDNHKNGDFKPYLLMSPDRGETWRSIAGDLPERDTVYSVQQDHERAELMFAGTEFGAWFTLDGGARWTALSGLPTIPVRDIDIHRRENDLILGTFGRGIYILDDYTPLRHATPEVLEADAYVFPVKPALRYIERSRLGGRTGRGSAGATMYTAPNPPFGAVFTYSLKEKLQSLQETRLQAEKKALEADKDVLYPSVEEQRAEEQEQGPEIWLVVKDDTGEVVRRLPGFREKGLHRVAWDLRYPSSEPVEIQNREEPDPWDDLPSGHLALPGTYTVTLLQIVRGETTVLCGPLEFEVVPLELATFAAEDQAAVQAFLRQVARLQRAVEGVGKSTAETQSRLDHLRQAIQLTPGSDLTMLARLETLDQRLKRIVTALRGDPTLSKREEPQRPSLQSRVQDIVGSQWKVTSPPTQTQRESYEYAGEAFEGLLARYRQLVQEDLRALEEALEAAGAPWTPGRIPQWTREEE